MALFTWRTSVANMLMRSASLGGRLILSLYLARMLGLEAVGVFGIITGIAGFAPAMLGLGISYFVNRELLGLSDHEAHVLIRDRLALNLCMAIAAWAVLSSAMLSGLATPTAYFWPTMIIVTLEYLLFDTQVMLINLRRPVTANFLLFIRSASWIGPFIILGLLDRELRTIPFMLGCWIAALIICIFCAIFVFRDVDVRAVIRTRIDWPAMLARARQAPLLYLNDLAANGQVYIDRFIVLHFAGLKATGLYVLIFSITHGLYVLTATAVTQLTMTKLSLALREHGVTSWRHILVSDTRDALMLAMICATPIVAVLVFALPAFDFSIFRDNATLLILMTMTSLLKPVADILNSGLYSLGLDRALALTNIGGVGAVAGLGSLLISAFGLVGTAIASILSLLAIILVRSTLLRKHIALRPQAA
ncbi:lipopolysaccharide biosynthesis protein [Sphingomonas crocodyli]|uniref:Lipopolysaccharide biosynthesis protein n=1 Tax=Sphingomonas crocodyli TaxID=1979270 RepID=A0A437LXS2_9SPHN|nr:hypothetical protein [Sphingomonas crocodyli]RVT90154.1 hypothetical protein EOD43_17770 [Sphingomonas crocodyli]